MAFFDIGLGNIIYRFSEIAAAPFQNPGVLWLGLPLIITIIAIELALRANSSYKEGFSHAFPNALVLAFVAIDLFRISFSYAAGFWAGLFSWNFLASLLVLGLGVAVFLIDYYKEFPKGKLFGFSAHLPINTLAYALLVIVYNKTGFDLASIIAIILFMGLLALLFFLVVRLETDGASYSSHSSGGPKHKEIWSRREKRKDVEIMPRHSKEDAESESISDPFRGVKTKIKADK